MWLSPRGHGLHSSSAPGSRKQLKVLRVKLERCHCRFHPLPLPLRGPCALCSWHDIGLPPAWRSLSAAGTPWVGLHQALPSCHGYHCSLSSSLPSVGSLDRSISTPAGGSGPGGGGAEGEPPPLKKARSDPLEDYSMCSVKVPSSSAHKVRLPQLTGDRHFVTSRVNECAFPLHALAGWQEDRSGASTGQGGHTWHEDTGEVLH